MANFSGGRMPAGAWRRRIALCCFGVLSTTFVLAVVVAGFLIASGVFEW